MESNNSIGDSKRYLTAAALSVEYMHKQGWTHRDIKPDNFLVNDENEVRLIDFTLGSED